MKIPPIAPQPIIKKYEGAAAQPLRGRSVQGKDEVGLSDGAVTFSAAMRSARAALTEEGPAYEQRLADLKQRIDEGTYRVPGDQIAERILSGLRFRSE